MKQQKFYLLLLLCCFRHIAHAQSPTLDESAFRSMAPSERYRFVHDCSFSSLDSAATTNVLDRMLHIVREENDSRAALAVKFRRFMKRDLLRPTEKDMIKNLSEIEQEAKKNGLEVEEIIGNFYFTYEKFNYKRLPPEQMYAEAQRTFAKMQAGQSYPSP